MAKAKSGHWKRVAEVGLVVASCLGVLALFEVAAPHLVAIRSVGPAFSEHHSVYGKHLKASFEGVRVTPEFTMRLSTDQFGFRGPAIDVLPTRPILFLGDSFTMGYGVDDGREFPALIAAVFDEQGEDVPVVNAGVGNNGNGRWVRLLDAIGETMDPRLVVMQVMENDFTDNPREGLFALDDAGALVELGVPEPGWRRDVQAWIEAVPGLASTNLVGLLRQASLSTAPTAAADEALAHEAERAAEGRIPLTVAIVERALAICAARGWPVLGVTVGLDARQQAAVDALFERSGVAVVETASKAERPELYFERDGHWNEAGHEETARLVGAALGRMGAAVTAEASPF